MKHSLDINIISDKQSVLDAIRAALPLQSDSKVWGEEYSLAQILPMGSNIPALVGSIRFNDGVDRDVVLSSIVDVAGIFPQCEVGSCIWLHTCYHDKPLSPCTIEVIYEVIP
mgnify:FL=1